ncbi:MAG: AAA family ATPase, partial [Rhodoferax sp.]
MTSPTPLSAALKRRKLPIGIQTFREIREDDCYYVDKTGMAVDLVKAGKYYFLSRPRRFGKSLFLDTLKDLFEGHRELFSGLAAEARWDWSVKYPVIRISFGAGVVHDRLALDQTMHQQLAHHEKRFDLPPDFPDLRSRFIDLIERLHTQAGQRVVVLVDEYDKPMLDNITEPAIAREMRDGLRNLYSVIKDS